MTNVGQTDCQVGDQKFGLAITWPIMNWNRGCN